MMDNDEKILSNRWQDLQLKLSDQNSSVRKKADHLRSMMMHLKILETTGRMSSVTRSDLTTAVAADYAMLVDSAENVSGLNNYSESILPNISSAHNESQQWKSSLNSRNMAKYIQKFNEQCQSIQSTVYDEAAHRDAVIQLPKPPPAEVKQQSKAPTHMNVPHSSRQYNKQSSVDGFSTGSISNTYKSNNAFGQAHYGLVSENRIPQKKKRPYSHVEDSEYEDQRASTSAFAFKTAREQLSIDQQKNRHKSYSNSQHAAPVYNNSCNAKRSLGTRRGPSSKFVPPVLSHAADNRDSTCYSEAGNTGQSSAQMETDEITDERLKNIDPKMIKLITNEIMDHGPPMTWDDIAGLEFAKTTIKEIVVWPLLRPDIFTGLRGPPKGLLLFGPPGTGKTLIGKCVASQSKSTFFSISASSLTSKWVGEGEKMVRALFAVARVHQPAVVFIDEIDSLLSKRSDSEHESSRRIKTEFLVQLDGAGTDKEDRILVIGATNRPQEIDDAARRRFVKRLYIPLPEAAARRHIVTSLLQQQTHQLQDTHLQQICDMSDGYSGADMASLCREAALGPIRSIAFEDIETVTAEQVRPITYSDFEEAFKHVRSTVSASDLDVYLEWNQQYGSWPHSK